MIDWDETGFYNRYVPLKANEKIPAVPYTNEENLIDLPTARGHQGFSGVLSRETVLVDSDDKLNSELLMKVIKGENLSCLISDRDGGKGLHSLMLNNGNITTGTKVMLACGIVVDIKCGTKNGLECIKFKGVERNVLYNKSPYQAAPKYFTPLKGCYIDFASLKKGDGRNQELFNYILTLQRFDFTVDEIRETIRIINKYVIAEPISDKELDVILRDDAFKKKAFFKNKTFLHDLFAEHIKSTYHIKKINGQLHIYQDGIYRADDNYIKSAMAKEIPSLTDAKMIEVLKRLNLLLLENTEVAPANLIAFRNGIYDIDADTLQPFSPGVVITNRIPWDYNPSAYSELADHALDKIACGDKQVRTILEECIGSCFYRSNTLGGGKAFILTGEGSNGKSTFIAMMQHLLNEDNISALDLKELDQKFQNTALFGKLANLGDDISDEFIVNASVFKKLVTGERIQVQNKGEKPFEFNNYAKFLFSANNIPRIKDKTGAVLRRLLIVPFNAEFSKNDPDYDSGIKYKLQEPEVMEYLIVLGIKALKNIIENKGFTESEKVNQQIEEYKIYNNPVLSFIDEVGEDEIENEPVAKVYELYQGFCIKNSYQALASNEFSKQVQRCSNLSTKRQVVNKRKITVFISNGQAE